MSWYNISTMRGGILISLISTVIDAFRGKNRMDKKGICKAYPHLVLYVGLNISLLVVTVAFLCLLSIDYGKVFRIINIVLAILLPIVTIVVFIYTTFSGWNAVVKFDTEKAYQKRGKSIINWYWKDITEITCRTYRPWLLWGGLYYPKFKLKSKSHKYVLVFVLNQELIEKFDTLCTNEEINQKFKTLIKECNFPFPHKYDND